MSRCYHCRKYFYDKENKIDVTPPRSKIIEYIIICNKCFKTRERKLKVLKGTLEPRSKASKEMKGK